MRKRLKWVEKERRISKIEFFRSRHHLKQNMTHRVMKKYSKIEKAISNRNWHQETDRSRKKISFLVEKSKKREEATRFRNRNNRHYKITDEELKNEPEINDENFVVYGRVDLSNAEKKCLNLGPKYMITPQLVQEDYEVEVELEAVKTRIELHKIKDMKEAGEDVTDEEKCKIEAIDKDSRQVFDKNTSTLRMSKLRVTDAKYNIRSYPPREAETTSELLIQNRSRECIGLFETVKAENSNSRGKLENINMTKEEIEGRSILMRRIREREIIVIYRQKWQVCSSRA